MKNKKGGMMSLFTELSESAPTDVTVKVKCNIELIIAITGLTKLLRKAVGKLGRIFRLTIGRSRNCVHSLTKKR
jgi:hypothetical protein